MPTRPAALLLSLLSIAAAATAPDDPIKVTSKPATTHTRVFDPANPGPDVHLTGREAAYTRSAFHCTAGLSYVVTGKTTDAPGRATATIRVDAVKVEITLDNTLFLPKTASPKLTAHEQAHRQIAEWIYVSAADVARRLASPLVGRSYSGTGDTPEIAAKNASHAVIQKLCDDYMATVPGRSSAVNDAFDRITDHGRNRVSEADAIEQSFRETAKP